MVTRTPGGGKTPVPVMWMCFSLSIQILSLALALLNAPVLLLAAQSAAANAPRLVSHHDPLQD